MARVDVFPVQANNDEDFRQMIEIQHGYESTFRHESEQVEPGSYQVYLDTQKIKLELTATEQAAGIYQYSFDTGDKTHRVILVGSSYTLPNEALGLDRDDEKDRFCRLVIFGDSLSDTGNVYRLTKRTYPISPPYYKGRFCDAPNWIDRLKVDEKKNYAYGGATTDNNFVQGLTKFETIPVPGVRQQVATYLKTQHKSFIEIMRRTLHVIWAGPNDIILNNTVTPFQIINSLFNSVKDLLAAGAKNIVIFNQVPGQSSPIAVKLNEVAALQKSHPGASIHMFDVHALLTKIISNTSSIKFVNTVTNCWDDYNTTAVSQFCSDPKKYVFLDTFHYTSSVHELIADAFQPILSSLIKDKTPKHYFRSF